MKRVVWVAFATLGALGCGDSGSPSGPETAPQPLQPGPKPVSPPPPPPPLGRVEQIAYFGISGSNGGLTLINSDGSGAARISSPGWSPAWSPDGRKLMFSTTQCDTDWETYLRCDQGGLVIMNFATGEVTIPAKAQFGEDPAWGPSGDEVAFVRHYESRGRRLLIMRLDGSEPREIATPGVYDAFGPSWSPDGKRIMFQCHGPGIGICVVNTDGSGFSRVASGLPGAAAVSPAWSPDGSQIAFAILSAGTGKIALMAPDGSGGIILTEGLGPAWSADGTRLAFSRNNDGLFTMNRDGSNVQRVTSGIVNSPAWRPPSPDEEDAG